MAGKTYVGVGGIARKVRNIYVGVNGVARKVKKVYVGVGGVARPCFSLEPVDYYGTATPMSTAKYGHLAAVLPNYAIFGEGLGTIEKTVDAYSTSLTRSSPTPFSGPRRSYGSASIGNYALFGGGADSVIFSYETIYRDSVDSYDVSLTHGSPTPLRNSKGSLSATSVGNHALFGGGRTNEKAYDEFDAYDTALTRSAAASFGVGIADQAAATVGNYALFGGGYSSSYSSAVRAISTLLTRVSVNDFSVPSRWPAATSIGDYVLFAGGCNGDGDLNLTWAYDTALTRSMPVTLSIPMGLPNATTLKNYALICDWSEKGGGAIDVFNELLVRTSILQLSVGRNQTAAAAIGNYALFAGGNTGSGAVATVDAYYITQ